MSSDSNQSQSTSNQTQDGAQSGEKTQSQSNNGNNRNHILNDEIILIETRPSWTVFVKSLTLAVLILLFGIISSGQGGSGAIIGITALISLMIFIYVWYRRKRIRYVITDRRAMIVVGITSKSTTELWLTKLTSMQTGSSFIERILGHGTIHLSNDTLSGSAFNPFASNRMTLGGIKDPVRVANTIRESKSD